MKHPMIAGLSVLVTSLTVQGAEPKTGPDTPAAEKTNPASQWRSQPPADCPFKPSASLTGIDFTGRHSDYRCGDTFYPSWASDGNLYSPWTDGKTDGVSCQSWEVPAHTGHAVMIGDDPLKLEILPKFPEQVHQPGRAVSVAVLLGEFQPWLEWREAQLQSAGRALWLVSARSQMAQAALIED